MKEETGRGSMPQAHNFKTYSKEQMPPFSCHCYVCGSRLQTNIQQVYVDIAGPAYRGYYCETCKVRAEWREKGIAMPQFCPSCNSMFMEKRLYLRDEARCNDSWHLGIGSWLA